MFTITHSRFILKRSEPQTIDEDVFKEQLLEQVSFIIDSEMMFKWRFECGEVKLTYDLVDYLDAMRERLKRALENEDTWELDDLEIEIYKELTQ